jgi:hypothetical protein
MISSHVDAQLPRDMPCLYHANLGMYCAYTDFKCSRLRRSRCCALTRRTRERAPWVVSGMLASGIALSVATFAAAYFGMSP